MKKILFILFIVCCALQIGYAQVAQQWVSRYNGTANSGDFAYAVVTDGAGNSYVTGYISTNSYPDCVTIKYNSFGVQQWAANFNAANYYDIGYAIAVDAAGNVYVTGTSVLSGTNYDIATIKYNSAGVQQWARIFNGTGNSTDEGKSIAVDVSGNVYITGYSTGSGTAHDVTTIKYNSSGVQQWAATYNGPLSQDDEGSAIKVDASGNVYVTGFVSSSADNMGSIGDYITIKYNSSGTQQWAAAYSNPTGNDDRASSLAIDISGNVYVTGYSGGSNGQVYATVKYNSSGVQQWAVRYDGPANSNDIANSIAVDASGNVYVTGESTGSGTSLDYATVKYNSSGVQQWVQRYSGAGSNVDIAYALVLDASANVYITGSVYSINSSRDYTTIKYNSSGVQQWLITYNGPGNGDDEAYSIAVDTTGYVYITGKSYGASTGAGDYATIRYIQTPSTPVLVSPANNSTGASLTPQLSWNAVNMSATYRLQLSTDSLFAASLINDSTLTGNTYNVGSGVLANNVKYYWRVNAKNTAGTSAYSTVWNFRTSLVGLQQTGSEIPKEFKLYDNYPNPFNPSTKIKFDIPSSPLSFGEELGVRLSVYDILGKQVATLVNQPLQPGRYEIEFDASKLSSGIYFYRVVFGSFTDIKKMMLIK